MKIVQTFWSCDNKDLLTFNAGWLSPEYNLIGWALSCLKLKEFYNNVELYTDSLGAKILIDTLHLPYSNVTCNLDDFNYYNKTGLWALPKIETYSLQQTPFLHIDGDVFIWKQFDDWLLQADLITQNEEAATDYYENILNDLEKKLIFFPEEIKTERENKLPVHAYNAGIFGGNDINFIQRYCTKAFEFVAKNKDAFDKIDTTNFNVFFEQYLFYCLCKKESKTVSVLLNEVIGDNQYKGFGNFNEVPYNKTYLHLLGNYKRNSFVCNAMASQLRKEYPSVYYKIIAIYKENKIPLYKDYYYSVALFPQSKFSESYQPAKDEALTDTTTEFSGQYNSYFDEAEFTSLVEIIKNNSTGERNLSSYFEDFRNLNSTIRDLVVTKFSQYNPGFLYKRDLEAANYFSLIFSNQQLVKDKVIIFDTVTEIVTSQYDWSAVSLQDENMQNKLLEQLTSEPSNTYTAVIPECHQKHCSLVNIDELDLEIIEKLKTNISIKELLVLMESCFEKEDLEQSRLEFEKLIIGRLQYGLQHKMYKPLTG